MFGDANAVQEYSEKVIVPEGVQGVEKIQHYTREGVRAMSWCWSGVNTPAVMAESQAKLTQIIVVNEERQKRIGRVRLSWAHD